MPSHTFTRIGLWRESVETNIRSMTSAEADSAIAETLHAADYAVYAYLQMRDEAAARSVLARLPELALTGADFVSVGALTHSAPAVDISFEIEP